MLGYNINLQTCVAFPYTYTNNKISERECKQPLLKLHPKKPLRNKPHQGGERLLC